MVGVSVRRSLLIGVLAVGLAAETGGAAIVCRHPRKAKVVRLEAGPECRAKGWVKVVDLDDLGDLGGIVEDELGTRCAQDPSRRLATTLVIDSPPAARHGCRRFDGDEEGCNAAFESDGGTGVACWYLRDYCFPCDAPTQGTRACVNACAPPQCPADPARTFAGETCNFLTEPECASHFAIVSALDSIAIVARGARSIGLGPVVPVAYGCYWTGSRCAPCMDADEALGRCTNACGGASCGTRTVPSCFGATDAGDCATRFSRSAYTGLPVSCVWTGASCLACDLSSEFLAKACTNECP